jgi:hypothetical protein
MVTMSTDTPNLLQALAEYNEALRRLRSIEPCLSVYPADPPGPDYPGTRCDLLTGHEWGETPSQHRHRFPGTRVVVTW